MAKSKPKSKSKPEKESKKKVKVEEPTKTKKKKRGKDGDEPDGEVKFDMHAYMNNTLDDVSKKLADADTLDDVVPMSTGCLIVDLILAGGIRPAMYTTAGAEQSAKTTLALLTMGSAIKHKVPLISMRDFEGSTKSSLPYVESQLRTHGVALNRHQIFGRKDKKTGEWVIKPLVRYSSSTKGESFFNWFVSVLRRSPDKKNLNDKWWYVYEDDKEHAHLKEFADMTMPRKFGKGIYIEAPDGGLQGIVILDSYPNMNPSMKDEEAGDNSLALQARMFSKNLPRVKGSLASKKFALWGINQLRAVPMAMYGPSETEPGGQALRYNSDARLRLTPRSLSAVPLWAKQDKKKKQFESEPSWNGEGIDYYEYKHIRQAKNKLGSWLDDGWIRIWKKDSQGTAHGIDPVFDAIYYLKVTGQLRGKKREALQLKLEDWPKPKDVSWAMLKAWILGDKETKIKICKKLNLQKPMDLRVKLFKQITNGTAEHLMQKINEAAQNNKVDEAGDGDGGDDE